MAGKTTLRLFHIWFGCFWYLIAYLYLHFSHSGWSHLAAGVLIVLNKWYPQATNAHQCWSILQDMLFCSHLGGNWDKSTSGPPLSSAQRRFGQPASAAGTLVSWELHYRFAKHTSELPCGRGRSSGSFEPQCPQLPHLPLQVHPVDLLKSRIRGEESRGTSLLDQGLSVDLALLW